MQTLQNIVSTIHSLSSIARALGISSVIINEYLPPLKRRANVFISREEQYCPLKDMSNKRDFLETEFLLFINS